MAIYKLHHTNQRRSITSLDRRTFDDCGIREVKDLQPALADCHDAIQEITPETLVVSTEYAVGRLKGTHRRIDLLGIDKNANIVVIELKRTEDGGFAELQAIRYAAMMANATFANFVEIYRHHLEQLRNSDDSAEELDLQELAENDILAHLDWEEPDEEKFGQVVKIVLVAADFAPELTTSVMWLNEYGLDIRCVRIQPYIETGNEDVLSEAAPIYLDIQTLIPLPETSDYQVARREKQRIERRSRDARIARPTYDLRIRGQHHKGLTGRGIIRSLLEHSRQFSGAKRDQINESMGHQTFEGEAVGQDAIKDRLRNDDLTRQPFERYFLEDECLYRGDDKTVIYTNQWTQEDAVKTANHFRELFPELEIDIERASQPG